MVVFPLDWFRAIRRLKSQEPQTVNKIQNSNFLTPHLSFAWVRSWDHNAVSFHIYYLKFQKTVSLFGKLYYFRKKRCLWWHCPLYVCSLNPLLFFLPKETLCIPVRKTKILMSSENTSVHVGSSWNTLWVITSYSSFV